MFNDPSFVKEFAEYIEKLGVKTTLEVGCLSGELKDAIGADGIDVNPQREDVVKVDVRKYKPKKKYDLVFSSGLLEHYPEEEAVKMLEAMAKLSKKYVLTYVPNSGCRAYMSAKRTTTAEWRDELDYTQEEIAVLHELAGLKVLETGFAGTEWAKRFGPEESEPYLVYVLAKV